jgi:hypothetical protein
LGRLRLNLVRDLNLAEAMFRKGDVVDAVIIPGWKATTVRVKILSEKMKESMGRRKPDKIVLMLFVTTSTLGCAKMEPPKPLRFETMGRSTWWAP